MLFNWVQPLFNRYAQRCAKGVTRVGVHTQGNLRMQVTSHKSVVTSQGSVCLSVFRTLCRDMSGQCS